ncbi:MAG: hypothetical protein WGN25_16070 [Candidatus Electrothrix sp. GW3-4]|uniref:hypothetical protein n=1 Tax=Candidatus Electrothrix sp. GW3-4 TaxID=3126740 RepID=UPI0030CDE13A
MKKLFLLCTCLIMLAACAKGPQPEDFPQTIELRSGASKKVSNDLTIRLNTVLEDSRCPTNVECAWEGNAEILLELSGGDLESTHLNTGGQFPKTEVYNGYTITLEDLKPHPVEGESIPEKDYIAVLSVDLETADEPATP